jgi:hypothetical protein
MTGERLAPQRRLEWITSRQKEADAMTMGKISGLVAAVLLGSLAGCAHTPTNPPPGPAVSGFTPSCSNCDQQPPLPRRFNPTPAPLPPGNPPPQTDFRPAPQADHAWKPLTTNEPPPQVRLSPPVVGESQSPRDPAGSPRDPAGEKNPLPVDVPQFAIARKQVASGQKPFPEGIDWLRDKGYRTVLFLRSPGEDDSAARRLFTAKGFRYLSLEVSPLNLNRDLVDEFNRQVKDPANLPLYVYDRDSSLAGGMWYLHFRISEGYDGDKAAIEAGRLGLNIDADGGPHRDMWLAIQKFLQPTNKPAARLGRIHMVSWNKGE